MNYRLTHSKPGLILVATIIGILLIPLFTFAQEPPEIDFRASPSTIKKGETATLVWNAKKAFECITRSGTLQLPNGIVQVKPDKTTDYFITCRGKGGTLTVNTRVTVEGTAAPSDENGNGGGQNEENSNGGAGSSAGQFVAACVANPTVAKIDQLVKFTYTHTGGAAISRQFWTGDISGTTKEIKTTFKTPGTKKAELFLLTKDGFTAEASCYAFVEPDAKPATPPPAAVTTNGDKTPPASPPQPETQKDEQKNNEKNLGAAAASEKTSGSLLFIILISILINIAILFYVFVFTKKKAKIEEGLTQTSPPDYLGQSLQTGPGEPPEAPEALFT